MESLAIWGEFLGGVGVIISLIFLGVQTRTSNRLALAASQREQRHIWQEMSFIWESTAQNTGSSLITMRTCLLIGKPRR